MTATVDVPEAIRARARRGAARLDRLFPGWHKLVKITALDQGKARYVKGSCGCVGAQIDAWLAFHEDESDRRGYYGRFLDRFGVSSENVLSRLGFWTPRGRDEYRLLTLAWKDEIRARRAAA